MALSLHVFLYKGPVLLYRKLGWVFVEKFSKKIHLGIIRDYFHLQSCIDKWNIMSGMN